MQVKILFKILMLEFDFLGQNSYFVSKTYLYENLTPVYSTKTQAINFKTQFI